MTFKKGIFTAILCMLFLAINVQNTFAHPSKFDERLQFQQQYEKLSDKEQKEVRKILITLEQNLNNLNIDVPFMFLTGINTKKIKDVEKGKLNAKEAEKELHKLWPNKRKRMKEQNMFEHLDEESKRKVKSIWKQMRKGEISKEQGKIQLEAFDIKFPKR